MSELTENIDNQLEFNRDKNILLDNLDIFQFSQETIKAIARIDSLSPESRKSLIEYATDKAIEEFCHVNQYYSFNQKAKNDLRAIYSDLFENLLTKTTSIEEISKTHYGHLKSWLKTFNPFAEGIYNRSGEKIEPVACSEYTPQLQIDILHFDTSRLMNPILDVGCGINGYMVNYLKKQGLEAYGIDRFKFESAYLINVDWLEYEYGIQKWGTIISHLGFSNHFSHHNLRNDGNYIAYAKTYMSILNSLKVGGSFHYTPDLPFIEKYLDINRFCITKHPVNEYDFKATVITKTCS